MAAGNPLVLFVPFVVRASPANELTEAQGLSSSLTLCEPIRKKR